MSPNRATDGPRKGRLWVLLRRADWVFQRLVPLFAIAVAAYAVASVAAEIRDRRDQNCVVFERQEQVAIQRLVSTYHYLRTLPSEDYGTNLTKAILRNLQATEADARASVAPDYCNKPGVGLPELDSDPQIPEHEDFSDRARLHP